MIEIHLYGKLRRFSDQKSALRESIVRMEARDGDSIRSIVERVGIPLNELGRRVKDGDRLGIFPDNMQLLYRQYFEKVEED